MKFFFRMNLQNNYKNCQAFIKNPELLDLLFSKICSERGDFQRIIEIALLFADLGQKWV